MGGATRHSSPYHIQNPQPHQGELRAAWQEVSASASRRDNTIVAWHEVPGKRLSNEPSRRVRYDRAQLVPEVFLVEICALFPLRDISQQALAKMSPSNRLLGKKIE